MKLLEFTKKSSANNYKQYLKLIQQVSKKVLINRFHFLMQLLSATRQNSGEFIFQQDCSALGNTLFSDINISQCSVVTHFRCDGIFNESFIANFQEIVKMKKN